MKAFQLKEMEEATVTPALVANIVGSCKLLFFGGKGGVGKTTIAACIAIQLAKANPGQKVLLMSADPAHSLSDMLSGQLEPLSTSQELENLCISNLYALPKVFSTLPNLVLQELDFSRLTQAFQEQYGETIQSVAKEGSLLSDEDINAFVNVSLPGLGEVMALLGITELLDSDSFSYVVVDTAPTGHTMRLLELPAFVNFLTEALELMQLRHENVVSQLVGRYLKTASDNLVAKMTAQAESLSRHLIDRDKTGVFVVSLAEGLALEETERFLAALSVKSIPVKAILINQVAKGNCWFCQERAASNLPYLYETASRSGNVNVFTVPLSDTEPRKMEDFLHLAEAIEPVEPSSKGAAGSTASDRSDFRIKAAGSLPDFLALGYRLLFFAGKGGVGKTSLASASALHLARLHGDKRVLAASIDPAHSLGDSFCEELSSEPKQITDNLWAVEIDANKLLAEFKGIYQEEFTNFCLRLLGDGDGKSGISFGQDKVITEKLSSLETPDLDEFMVFRRLALLRSSGNFDMIIIDPAPAGHFFRFLELPAIAQEWIRAVLTVITGHKAVEEAQNTVRELLMLTSAISDFQLEIVDKHKAAVVAVTTAREVVLTGTLQMLQKLKTMNIECGHMVINMVRPDVVECPFCCALHKSQVHNLEPLSQLLDRYKQIWLDQANTEIKGLKALSVLGGALYG